MQVMTREDGAAIIREAFELLRTGRMTAREYSRLFDWVTAATTAHPVRRVGV